MRRATVDSSTPALRVAVLGAGIRGKLYATALVQHPDAEVVGIADLDVEAARRSGDDLGVASFPGHEAILAADLGLDAVVVATPDFAHHDAAVAAAESGLHLLVEKPLATTVQEARSIADAVSRNGVRCMVGFENRWNPRFLSVKALVSSGGLGDMRSQVTHLHDTTFVPTQMLRWAARSSPAWFLMPHSLDLTLWLSGKVVARVYATGVRGQLCARGVDTWDTVDAVLTFTDGTTATLHSSWVLPESFPSVYDLRYEAIGSTGAIRVNGSDHGVHLFADATRWPQHGTYSSGGRLVGFPVDMAYTFAEHALGRCDDVPTVNDGLLVTEVLAAIDESLSSGQPAVPSTATI